MWGSRDHYSALGLLPGADWEELRRAHQRLVLDCHPDRQPAPLREVAQAAFIRVQQAWDVLRARSPTSRAQMFFSARPSSALTHRSPAADAPTTRSGMRHW